MFFLEFSESFFHSFHIISDYYVPNYPIDNIYSLVQSTALHWTSTRSKTIAPIVHGHQNLTSILRTSRSTLFNFFSDTNVEITVKSKSFWQKCRVFLFGNPIAKTESSRSESWEDRVHRLAENPKWRTVLNANAVFALLITAFMIGWYRWILKLKVPWDVARSRQPFWVVSTDLPKHLMALLSALCPLVALHR